jgi:hypothetical protein
VPGRIVIAAEPDGVVNARLHVTAAGLAPGSHPLAFEARDAESGESVASASAFLAGGAP